MTVKYYPTIIEQITAMLIHHHIALEKVNYIKFTFLTPQIYESAAATLNNVIL